MTRKISWSWAFILVGLLQWKTDRWWPQWVGMTVATSLCLIPFLKERFGAWITATMIYVVCHYGLFTLTMTRFPFLRDFSNTNDRLILRTQGLEFFTYALLFTLLAVFQFSPYRINVRTFFARMYFAVLIATFGTWVLGYGYEGYLGNWGMNICLLVCLTPFVPRYMWFISVMLAILSDASTAYAVTAVVFLSEFRSQWKKVTLGLCFAAAVAALVHPVLLSDSQRFINWKIYLNYWWENMPVLGFGPGSFAPIGPYLQTTFNNERGNFLLWAHNEYLQVFFEFGVVGFVLFAGCFVRIIRSARPIYQSMLLGSLACALTDYPFRLALFMFVIVLAISEVLYGRKKRILASE